MKKYILPIILSVLICVEVIYIKDISKYVSSLLNSHPNVIIQPSNTYTKDYDFMYVQQSKSYVPYSYGDLMNIFYSIINNGWTDFTFYCPEEYDNCLKDVQTISNNDSLLTSINNFAHPFNSFISVKTAYDDSGEVNVTLKNLYNAETQSNINKKVDEIISKNITADMSQEEKIKAIHDYIINNTEYEVEPINSERNGVKIIKYASFYEDEDYVLYLDSKIEKISMRVEFSLSELGFSPCITDLKLLISEDTKNV